MNSRQKNVQEAFLNEEEVVIRRLKSIYAQSLKEITKKSEELQKSIDSLTMATLQGDLNDDTKKQLQSMIQSKVYQKQYQDALKKQIGSILDNLQVEEFKTVSEYLNKCYEEGFLGTMYDLHGQGIPLIFPINQEAVVRAVQLDSKVSDGLYQRLGEDVSALKRKITSQVSRGIATGMSFSQMAKGLSDHTNIGYNNAIRITRTEGHRIQVQSGMDACNKAKDMGADVVKQWDSTLDGRTRPSHKKVDGEIRELDEAFSNGLMFPGDPDGGASEVVNCRCALLQRARWALDDDELDVLKERAEFFGIDKTENFEDFKKKYLDSVKYIEKISKSSTMKSINAPEIYASEIKVAKEEFRKILANSKGEERHVSKMILYDEYAEYVLDETSKVPFQYLSEEDIIMYNPKAPNFDLYDMNYVQAHELSHRMDVLEYESFNNPEFIKAIDICKKEVENNADEIKKWFEEDGKYENSFAISDIISALSNNTIDVPIGHSDEYWEKESNVALELFANISSIDVLDDSAKEEFGGILKALYDSYKEIVG